MSELPTHSDVVVIGGGAAGLSAARHLTATGYDCLLLESTDRLGGRIATDVVDGYRLDRGFQVVNTAYPALRALVPLAELDLRYFDHGVLVRHGGRLQVLADPRHHPALVPATLRSPLATFGAVRRLAALSVRLGYLPPRALLGGPEHTAGEVLRDRLDPITLDAIVEPFLTGVLGADPLDTSDHVLAMIWRSFVRGRIGVPSLGATRLAELLAAGIPPERIHLNTAVRRVADGRVETHEGVIHADAVIVATDPVTATELLPGLGPPPLMRVLVTAYHSSSEPPTRRPMLALDGERTTGIANSVVLTNAAPTYAPAGKALIATTYPEQNQMDEGTLRHRLEWLYGVSTASWEHVATVRAVPGLVSAPPPQGLLRCPVRLDDHTFVAGDHRDSPSLQGALVSGHRAARAVRHSLSGTPGVEH